MNQDAITSPFTRIGEIVRSHGLDGELKIKFERPDKGLIEQLEMVYVRNDRGDFYPCRIVNLRVESKANTHSFFVQFDHIADRNGAEALKGHSVFLENETALTLFGEPGNDDHLIDFEVLNDQNESIGLVIDETDNGAQVLITVGTTSGALLIPVVDEYVSEIDRDAKTIRCQNLSLLEDL